MSSVLPVIAALGAGLAMAGSATGVQTIDPTSNIPLVAVGGGAFDILDNAEQDRAGDMRFEYRFGNPWFLNVKPFIALEATTDWGGGAFAGLVSDFTYGPWVFSPSFGAGLWGQGDGKDMGSAIEFRSQLEAGYKFENGWRVTGALSHISNANISNTNPGAEIATIYLHIPADSILPR